MAAFPVAREYEPGRSGFKVARNTPAKISGRAFRRVAACVDSPVFAQRVIPHALTIASALGARLTLIRVLEPTRSTFALPDPVAWDIRRREVRDEIEELARTYSTEDRRIEADVIEGVAAEEIGRWSRDHEVDLIVLCFRREGEPTEWCYGGTVQRLLERAQGSLLLVPSATPDARRISYRRVLVPLDGSSRAESVLSLAAQIVQAERAELLLAHVVPVPELTEIGPLESEAINLREQLVRRNERVAHEYLDRVRSHIVANSFSVRTLVLRGGDTRSRLVRLVADAAVDLVVISTHGRSALWDVSCGSVAAHLLSQVAKPVLAVSQRPGHAMRDNALAAGQTTIRFPDHAAL